MSLVSINDVLKITTKVEKIHPYKVVGDRDSYSPYNEGWSDCVCLIEHYLEQLPSAEPEERTAKVKKKRFYGTSSGVVGDFSCTGLCGNCDCEVVEYFAFCPKCGARLEWK